MRGVSGEVSALPFFPAVLQALLIAVSALRL
jgi:hypothetical protein